MRRLVLRSSLVLAVVAAAGPALPSPSAVAQANPVVTEHAGSETSPGQVTLTLPLDPGDRAGLQRLATRPRGSRRHATASEIAAVAPPSARRVALVATIRKAGFAVTDDTWSLHVSGDEGALHRWFDGRTMKGVTAVLGFDRRPAVHRLDLPSYTPTELRSAYAVDRPITTGAGTTVATVQFSGWSSSSLTTFAGAAGIPLRAGQLMQVSVDGASTATASGDGDVEVALDQEAILGQAPAASQRAYFGPNTVAGVYDTYNALANQVTSAGIDVASSSWGACEPSQSVAVRTALRDAVSRAVAAGATFFAASGDSGAYDCSASSAPDNTVAVDFPASLPEMVAVGGTALNRSGSGFSESAWSTPSGSTGATQFRGSGSGGGQSASYARPSYQAGLSLAGSNRLVPDVAADADPATGVGAYLARLGFFRVGGTSAAAPLWAGQLAAALSSLGCVSGLGDIHALLYGSTAFNDITSGNNLLYTAGPGYDEATGLGSPVWRDLTPVLETAAGCAGGTFFPLTPSRVLDTRFGTGAAQAKVGPGGVLTVVAAGAGGVPTTGVSAVVVNVTLTGPTARTFLTAYPAGATRPNASSLNAVAGQTVPNLVTVGLGTGGAFSLYNDAGSVDLIADVVGYYSDGTTAVGSRFQALTPSRVLDTRDGTGAPAGQVGPAGTVSLQVTGVGGVATSNVSAVVLNVTAAGPTATSFITVYPSGSSRPNASNLNTVAGRNIPNLVVSPVGNDGKVVLYNDTGSVHLIADVVGYFRSSAGRSGTRFASIVPTRVLDTRDGTGGVSAPVGPGATITPQVVGLGGVAISTVSSVLVNATAVNPTARSYLTVWPSDGARPGTSSLNVDPGDVVANLVSTRIGPDGRINVFNAVGSTDVLLDVVGFSYQ